MAPEYLAHCCLFWLSGVESPLLCVLVVIIQAEREAVLCRGGVNVATRLGIGFADLALILSQLYTSSLLFQCPHFMFLVLMHVFGGSCSRVLTALFLLLQITLFLVSEGGEVCIIERLFSSSLVALVEMSNPRKLRVCHFKKNSEICTYSYPDTILSVKLNRQVMIISMTNTL